MSSHKQIYRSYAKINFYLEVNGYSTNNYHLLDSLMAFIDLYDEIHLSKNDGLEFDFSGTFASAVNPADNTLLRATELMAAKYNFDPKLKISVKKNIPVGAGLGGGSTNAATMILLLNQLYNLQLTSEAMLQIGLTIGADVPFCLNRKLALVNGIGDKIQAIEFAERPLFAALVMPNKQLATKTVFDLFRKNYQHLIRKKEAEKIQPSSDFIQMVKARSNHLEYPSIAIFPEIKLIIGNLAKQKNCLLARMSGSGSTCFGLFSAEQEAQEACLNLQKIFPDFYIYKTRILYQV